MALAVGKLTLGGYPRVAVKPTYAIPIPRLIDRNSAHNRLSTLIDVHMLNPHELRAAAP
jgi:hypothetical protein